MSKKAKVPYIRVGVDYFKVIKKKDRFNIELTELKRWNKSEIIQDHGKALLHDIPKYDDFTLEPDNVKYKSRVNNCFNMYSKFPHTPIFGKWEWTEKFLSHIFGDQYRQGLVYLQCLYLYPKQALPVLVLISKERSTGKSTFIDWLNVIFANNMVIINPEDIVSDFNSIYADKNIIAIEETLIEKSHAVEKIKSLSTQKFIAVNMKHVSNFKLPFYGKILMASNNENKFIKVDDKEIRFFVRKIPTPKEANHNILNDMIKEIPAFLHFLSQLPKPDFSKSRMVLTPEEISNDILINVKQHSRSWLYHQLEANFIEYFCNHPIGKNKESVTFTVKDIQLFWFENNQKVTFSYLKQTFLDDFELLISDKKVRYNTLNDDSKSGWVYELHKTQVMPLDLNPTENQEDEELEDVPF